MSTPHRPAGTWGRCGVRRQPQHPAQLQPCPLLCSEPTPGLDIKTGGTLSSHWPVSLTRRATRIWSLVWPASSGRSSYVLYNFKNFLNFTVTSRHALAGPEESKPPWKWAPWGPQVWQRSRGRVQEHSSPGTSAPETQRWTLPTTVAGSGPAPR